MTLCACGCGASVPYSRGAKYASGRCRAKASRERRQSAPVMTGVKRTSRVLRSGMVQVILHMPPLFAQEAHRAPKGARVRVSVP